MDCWDAVTVLPISTSFFSPLGSVSFPLIMPAMRGSAWSPTLCDTSAHCRDNLFLPFFGVAAGVSRSAFWTGFLFPKFTPMFAGASVD